MTENELDELKDAICELVCIAEDVVGAERFIQLDNAGADTIDCLDELGGYRAIGTIEECRTAVERMKPKKPVVKYGCTFRCPPDCGGEEFDEYGDVYHCPNCDRELSYSLDDVCRCGQAIDWRI